MTMPSEIILPIVLEAVLYGSALVTCLVGLVRYGQLWHPDRSGN